VSWLQFAGATSAKSYEQSVFTRFSDFDDPLTPCAALRPSLPCFAAAHSKTIRVAAPRNTHNMAAASG
jgi:hypothetical protein